MNQGNLISFLFYQPTRVGFHLGSKEEWLFPRMHETNPGPGQKPPEVQPVPHSPLPLGQTFHCSEADPKAGKAVGCQPPMRAVLTKVKTQTKAASPAPASRADWHLTWHWSNIADLLRTVLSTRELPRRFFWWGNLHIIKIGSVSSLIVHSLHQCKSRGKKCAHSSRSHVHTQPEQEGFAVTYTGSCTRG